MTIWLHGFISSGKRYVQVDTQTHHIIGIFRKILNSSDENVKSAYFQCEEDGTITFYQGKITDKGKPGIWTYLVYKCRDEEKVFTDLSVDTSTIFLKQLLAGKKLVKISDDINNYLNCKYKECEYLDVQLPASWNTKEGREIANLLVEEFIALKSSFFFAEEPGNKYTTTVLEEFIQAAIQVLKTSGDIKEFEAKQYDILKKIKVDEIVNKIIDYNDYRIWQKALPTQSKAVEHAFNSALNLIYRIN